MGSDTRSHPETELVRIAAIGARLVSCDGSLRVPEPTGPKSAWYPELCGGAAWGEVLKCTHHRMRSDCRNGGGTAPPQSIVTRDGRASLLLRVVL